MDCIKAMLKVSGSVRPRATSLFVHMGLMMVLDVSDGVLFVGVRAAHWAQQTGLSLDVFRQSVWGGIWGAVKCLKFGHVGIPFCF